MANGRKNILAYKCVCVSCVCISHRPFWFDLILNNANDHQPTERAKVTFKRRIDIAKGEFAVGPTCHLNNGDEENVPDFVGQFHKTLPHDDLGRV